MCRYMLEFQQSCAARTKARSDTSSLPWVPPLERT